MVIMLYQNIINEQLMLRLSTRHLCFKNSKNLRLQDILAFNSAIMPVLEITFLTESLRKTCKGDLFFIDYSFKGTW